MLEQAIWWTGACVLAAGAALAAAGVVVGLSTLAVILGTHYARRFGHVGHNLRAMAAWDAAGRPVWAAIEEKGKTTMRMVPSVKEKAHD